MIFKKLSAQLLQKTMVTIIGMILLQAISFIIALALSRNKMLDIFGEYQFFIGTCSFFVIVSKYGLDEKIAFTFNKTTNWDLTKSQRQSLNNTLARTFRRSIISGLAIILFYFCFNLLSINPVNQTAALYAVIYLPSFVLVIMISSIFRSQGDITNRTIATYFVPAIVICVLLGGFYFTNNLNLNTLFITRTLAYVLASTFCLITVQRRLPIKYSIKQFLIRKDQSVRDKKFQWFLFPIICFLIETGTIYVWLLRLFESDEIIGEFSVLFRLSNIILIIPLALSIVLANIDENRDEKSLKPLAIKIITLILIIITLVLLSYLFLGETIISIFDSSLVPYKMNLVYLVLSLSLFAITSPLQSILLSQKKIGIVFKINIISISLSMLPLIYLNAKNDLSQNLNIICASLIIFGLIRTYSFVRIE